MAVLLLYAVLAHAAPPEVDLALDPMSGSINVHPNVLLSFSTDQTASRAAYLDGHERYDRTHEYQGYFNPLKCYAYQGGNRNVVDGYFYVLRDADLLHECSQSFSGNFMNWASASLLDILRYALTGGDRVIDTAQESILQRAVLLHRSYADPRYFPRKILTEGGNASAPSRVTPFKVATLFVVSCMNRILFSDVQGSANDCDTPAYDQGGKLDRTDKRLGEYLARVRVCDRQEGPSRADLCRAYGKYYKPAGVLQLHADSLRFSLMSYLLDDSEKRYGGVLRSPMRHIGKKEFSMPDFALGDNPAAEWDPETGVFYPAPDANFTSDANTGGLTGYVNRFGRSGRYKKFDPIGELYYEGLRYLQGKPPTPAALENADISMRDGLPIVSSGADPVIAECQRNYLISVGDANTHWDRYIPGNLRSTLKGMQPAYDSARPVESAMAGRSPALDVKPWTAKVGEMEADPAGRHANPSPRTALGDLHLLDTGEEGHGTYYMAGLAYWANTQDIRHDRAIRVRSLTIDLDDGGNGRLDGGGRTIKPQDSQLFLAAKYGGFRDANADGNPFVTFADDRSSLVRFSTGEWEGWNSGMPEAYLLGGEPRRLIEGMRNMFAMLGNDGTDRFSENPRHSVLVQAAQAGKEAAMMYQAGFSRERWGGSLKKFSVNLNADGHAVRSAAPLWDAGLILSGTRNAPPFPLPSQRKIYTSSMQSGKPHRTVEFTWQALDAAQRSALNAVPAGGEGDGLGEKRLDYLRGVRTFEMGRPNGIFRSRHSLLGDVVNSIPVHAGPSGSSLRNKGFSLFNDRPADHEGTIYIGANDGMLHAFDAGSGEELFAYLPHALLPRLPLLTQPDYRHRPYVDGGISVADAKVSGTWRTVLAAGMGAGAQGVFALDVSDPRRFAEGLGALWEFTDDDDPDIGNVMGAPQIAKFRTRLNGGLADYEYFVVVPSGLNNYKPDGAGRFGTSGQAALFLLSLQKDPSSPWKLGVNYYKIKLPAGEAGMQSGLSAPVLAGSADDVVSHAYAGDLQGNLWRFDFTDGAPWSRALGVSPRPVFTARDDEGHRQPITTQPKLIYAEGNAYIVLFGTGKFLEAEDAAPAGFRVQSFYGIRDKPGLRISVDGRKALSPRSLAPSAQDKGVFLHQAYADSTPPAAGGAGWYFDFPASEKTGERMVFNPVAAFGRLFISTLLPSATPCERDGGRMYVADALTGLPVNGSFMGYTLAPGAIGSPLVLPQTVEAVSPQAGTRGKTKKRYAVLDPNGEGPVAAGPPALAGGGVSTRTGRLSWREITNWQELRDEAFGK